MLSWVIQWVHPPSHSACRESCNHNYCAALYCVQASRAVYVCRASQSSMKCMKITSRVLRSGIRFREVYSINGIPPFFWAISAYTGMITEASCSKRASSSLGWAHEEIAEQQEAQSDDGDADAHLLLSLGRKA